MRKTIFRSVEVTYCDICLRELRHEAVYGYGTMEVGQCCDHLVKAELKKNPHDARRIRVLQESMI